MRRTLEVWKQTKRAHEKSQAWYKPGSLFITRSRQWPLTYGYSAEHNAIPRIQFRCAFPFEQKLTKLTNQTALVNRWVPVATLIQWKPVLSVGLCAFLAIVLGGEWPGIGAWMFITSLCLQISYLTMQEGLFLIDQLGLSPVQNPGLSKTLDIQLAKKVEFSLVPLALMTAFMADLYNEVFPVVLITSGVILYFGHLILRYIRDESTFRNLAVALYAGIPFWMPALFFTQLDDITVPVWFGTAAASVAFLREHMKELYEIHREESAQMFQNKKWLAQRYVGMFAGVVGFGLASVMLFGWLRPIPSLALVLSNAAMLVMIFDLLLTGTPKRADRVQSQLLNVMTLMLVVITYDTIVWFLGI